MIEPVYMAFPSIKLPAPSPRFSLYLPIWFVSFSCYQDLLTADQQRTQRIGSRRYCRQYGQTVGGKRNHSQRYWQVQEIQWRGGWTRLQRTSVLQKEAGNGYWRSSSPRWRIRITDERNARFCIWIAILGLEE